MPTRKKIAKKAAKKKTASRPSSAETGCGEPGCRDIGKLLFDYVEGALPAATAKALEAHLGHCPPCEDYIASYRKAVELGKKTPCEDIPEEVSQRLRDFLSKRGVPVRCG